MLLSPVSWGGGGRGGRRRLNPPLWPRGGSGGRRGVLARAFVGAPRVSRHPLIGGHRRGCTRKRKNEQGQNVCFPLFTLFGLRLRKKGVRYTIHLLPSIHFCPVDLYSRYCIVQTLLQNDDICKEQTLICGFRTLLLPVSATFFLPNSGGLLRQRKKCHATKNIGRWNATKVRRNSQKTSPGAT